MSAPGPSLSSAPNGTPKPTFVDCSVVSGISTLPTAPRTVLRSM